MRALVSHEPGPVESLVVEEVPDPVAGPGQALVRVRAAALNFPDVLLVGDGYQLTLPRPFTPGSELAGEVVAVGEGVSSVAVGDLVAGTSLTGALAELCVVRADALAVLGEGADLRGAAAVEVTGTTAWRALQVARVGAGDLVLVLGASGGVGLAGVQVAKALGATVVAAASSAAKLAHCRAAGADLLVDYADGPAALRAGLKEVAPQGVAAVLDPVGGPYSEQAARGCARGARFVTLGYASGEIPCLPLNLVLLKDLEVRGYDMRAEGELHPARAATVREEVFGLFESGALRPVVSEVLGLDEAVRGLRLIADRKAVGKILVEPWR